MKEMKFKKFKYLSILKHYENEYFNILSFRKFNSLFLVKEREIFDLKWEVNDHVKSKNLKY